jgi:hypothetical protein
MSTTKNTPNSKSNLIENDRQYEVVPRRRYDRRSTERQLDIKSELAVKGNDITVVDNKHADLVRKGERRQSDRRTSRPTILSVDEIATLRKK